MKNDKIIVAHIMGKMVGGGVEAVVMNYYKHIDKNRVQFDFIIDKDSTYVPTSEIESLGGRIIKVSPYQQLGDYLKELRQVFRTNHYTIVHSHINTLSLFPLYCAKKEKVPIRIAHSHSTSNRKELAKNTLKGLFKPFSKLFPTHYFCCSKLGGQWLFGEEADKKKQVTLIQNASEVDRFLYNEQIRNQKRKELGLKKDTLVIGHIGRFVKQKNHQFLIDIFYEIHKKDEKAILVLAGDGPDRLEIQAKVKKLGLQDNVKFLGLIKDADKFYQAIDVFLLPSLYEGLPVVGVEAQAAGLLCFFSDDMTKETKILTTTKFVSLDKSAKVWAEIILKNYRKFVRKNTREEIRKANFDIEIEAKKLENIYLKLYQTASK